MVTLWRSRGFEGWPCTISAFKGENKEEYSWCLEIHIAQLMFDQLLQRYQHKTLAMIYITVNTDMMIDEVDRYSWPRGHRQLFLICETGRTDFPTQAIGEVNSITFTEPKFTFAPPEKEEPPPRIDEALTEIAALRERIQAIEQRLQLLTERQAEGLA